MSKTVFDMGRSVKCPSSWAEFVTPDEIKDIHKTIERRQIHIAGLIIDYVIMSSLPQGTIIFKGDSNEKS